MIPSFRFLPATLQGPPLFRSYELKIKKSIESYRSSLKGAPWKPRDYDPQLKRPEGHRNSFRVPQQHILYDTQVAAQLALERTGQEILPPTETEDKEVERIANDCAERQESIDLPPGLVPCACRRAMGLVFAPWLNLDGAESGVFCQECLYLDGKDRNHAWEVFVSQEECESCKWARHEDRKTRRRLRYSLILPGGSDVLVL